MLDADQSVLRGHLGAGYRGVWRGDNVARRAAGIAQPHPHPFSRVDWPGHPRQHKQPRRDIKRASASDENECS